MDIDSKSVSEPQQERPSKENCRVGYNAAIAILYTSTRTATAAQDSVPCNKTHINLQLPVLFLLAIIHTIISDLCEALGHLAIMVRRPIACAMIIRRGFVNRK